MVANLLQYQLMKTLLLGLSFLALARAMYLTLSLKGRFSFIIKSFFILQPILIFLVVACWIIADWFTGCGFDDSVFYHLRFGTEGAGISDFTPQILIFIFIFFLGVVISGLYYYLCKRCSGISVSVKEVLFSIILLIISYAVNPAVHNLFGYFYLNQIEKDFPLYFHAGPEVVSVKSPRNVLYLYLEGLERTYLDKTIFPGLLPNLSVLEEKSVSFTHVDQPLGASWTIAGMVSSQCGLPLLMLFTNYDFSLNEFIPNARCLGDMLQEQGYRLEYMGGAKSEFAGKGLFYRSHGFSRIDGLQDLLQEPDYVNSWGLHDDTLYDLLAQRFTLLGQQSQPFALFSINVGTHQPQGYIARSCEKFRYGNGRNKHLNAVHCTDKLIGDFLNRIKTEPAFTNTLIVLVSDHLAPPATITTPLLEKGDRKNLFMVIDPGREPGTVTRPGTTLDITPTLLGYLNFGSTSLGLGRDLNGSEKTLLETFGSMEAFNRRLLSWRASIDEILWGYPSMPPEVAVSPDTMQVSIGERRIKYPVLITYQETGKINEIWYSSPRSIISTSMTPAAYLSSVINNTMAFLWLDSCVQIHTLAPALKKENDAFCYYSGSLAGRTPRYGAISQTTTSIAINPDPSAALSIERANQLREKLRVTNLIHWDKLNILNPSIPPVQIVKFISAGQDSVNGPSFLLDAEFAEPGLHLAQIIFDSKSEQLTLSSLPVDICPGDDVSDVIAKSFGQNVSSRNSVNTLFYAIAGSGSVNCQKVINAGRISGLKMPGQTEAGMPYLAILDSQENVLFEKQGRVEQTLGLDVLLNSPGV
jgi:phosphoglycerol transferase